MAQEDRQAAQGREEDEVLEVSRRPPPTIKRVEPAIRQVRPQIRDMDDPNAPSAPGPQPARTGQIYMPTGETPIAVPSRSTRTPEVRTTRGKPGGTDGTGASSPKNAELRGKIALLNRELDDLRTVARALVVVVMARSRDAACKLAAEEVMAHLRGQGKPASEKTEKTEKTENYEPDED